MALHFAFPRAAASARGIRTAGLHSGIPHCRHPPLPAPWCHWAAFCAGVAERHIQPRAYCRPRALPLGCAQGCSPTSGFPIRRGPPRCPGARRIPGLLPGEENHERGMGPAAKQPPASWPAPAAGAGSTADLPSTPPCPGCANTASIPPPPLPTLCRALPHPGASVPQILPFQWNDLQWDEALGCSEPNACKTS